MNLNNYIFCILGKSGSGKTTIVDRLNREYGYNVLKSYTTRPPRKPDDTDHVFISESEFDDLNDVVAFTKFNGYRYCATKEQIDSTNLYVIDLKGLEQLKQLYDGEKQIVSIYIDTPMDVCLERMRRRGDSEDKIWDRLRHDDEAFRGILGECDFAINGIPESAWYEVSTIINNVLSHVTLQEMLQQKGVKNIYE